MTDHVPFRPTVQLADMLRLAAKDHPADGAVSVLLLTAAETITKQSRILLEQQETINVYLARDAHDAQAKEVSRDEPDQTDPA